MSAATPSRKPARPLPPDDAALAALLGKAKPHWDALLAAASGADASCAAEWVYYASLKGWRCIVKVKKARGGKQTLVHLRPDEGSYLASFALSDAAIAAAAGRGVPAPLITEVRAAKVLPEGRPIRVQVKSAKDLRAAAGLLLAKLDAAAG